MAVTTTLPATTPTSTSTSTSTNDHVHVDDLGDPGYLTTAGDRQVVFSLV